MEILCHIEKRLVDILHFFLQWSNEYETINLMIVLPSNLCVGELTYNCMIIVYDDKQVLWRQLKRSLKLGSILLIILPRYFALIKL